MEGPGFIRFANGLNPRYKVPSRSTIHRKIDQLFGVAKDIVAAKIDTAEGIAITMDGVTLSQTSKKYLVATLHFFDEKGLPVSISIGVFRLLEKSSGMYLKECILDMLTTMGVDHGKVKYITTDGATNMVEASGLEKN